MTHLRKRGEVVPTDQEICSLRDPLLVDVWEIDIVTHGVFIPQNGLMTIAPLALTKKTPNAFESMHSTINSYIVFGMFVSPTDQGLVVRYGDFDPSWPAVFVAFQHSRVVSVCAIYRAYSRAQIDAYGGKLYHLTSPIGKVSNGRQCRGAFLDLLTPKIGVVLHVGTFEFLDDRIEQVYDDEAPVPPSKGGVGVNIQINYDGLPSKLDERMARLRQCRAFVSKPEKLLMGTRTQTDWRPHCEHRLPYLIARYCEFYLRVPSLPIYVVLWIFDWLEYSELHRAALKLHWLERIRASIRRTIELRAKQRVTRSTKRAAIPLTGDWAKPSEPRAPNTNK